MQMRRKDRELTAEETRNILENGIYGILSTIGEDGYPYGVPVNYVYDRNKDAIYIHGTREVSHKYANMEFSSKACFTVITKAETLSDKFSTSYQSAIMFGNIHVLQDGRKVLEAFIEKYSHDFKADGIAYVERAHDHTRVYEFAIESITGKAK